MKNFFAALVIILFALPCFAQDLSLFQKKEFTYSEGKVLPYRILYPENYDKSKKYPLVLFLHGAGERGKDNEKQLVHGSKMFLSPANRKDFPAIVVFPQCPEESFWSSLTADTMPSPGRLMRYINW
jgi:predicted peptidase